ncbi:protein transport protein SFT2 [Biomphalaria pfeifferi]|uniref:Vesicle transport protein n=1 Tax=Biomphalaria pfeifferi TaxID=112525 RepID=A0AAD8ARU5_BIOPF|nr:protein transport protein SFT2 [Biomphalaria pfeifferi]
MADISQSLKDYMSRSNKEPSANVKYSFLSTKWFSSGEDIEDKPQTEAANSWFIDAQSDPFCPSLSKKQRIIGFIICLLMGTFCLSLASLYIPFLVLKARKFAMLYTLGSLFVLSSFALLWGPMNHFKHLFSVGRLPFTTTYFGSMLATLYFSLWVQSTVLTIVFAVAQIVALVWYLVSYIPGGQTGLKFFTSIFYAAASKTVGKTLPM